MGKEGFEKVPYITKIVRCIYGNLYIVGLARSLDRVGLD